MGRILPLPLTFKPSFRKEYRVGRGHFLRLIKSYRGVLQIIVRYIQA
nr:MAG TPA: hypothetical protein [Caudoviricetes sp.]